MTADVNERVRVLMANKLGARFKFVDLYAASTSLDGSTTGIGRLWSIRVPAKRLSFGTFRLRGNGSARRSSPVAWRGWTTCIPPFPDMLRLLMQC